jgi:beta-lactamase regulating signal transducer with metallopeptidase domain
MAILLDIGIRNALMALLLALFAVVVSRCCRRPALTHALWLLVLLKLVTPPLLSVPLPWPSLALGPTPSAEVPPASPEAVVEAANPPSHALQDELAAEAPGGIWMVTPEDANEAIEPEAAPAGVPAAATRSAAETHEPFPWLMLLALTWATGTVVCLCSAARQIVRFHRLLRLARPATPALKAQVRQWAAELGITRCPHVWLLPGRISPLIWGLTGRVHLILPKELFLDLDEVQRRVLITHELAHLRRRDHWVRGLEVLVTALYWWFPVVWWARYELQEAEEQCCDAWVLAALPQAAKTYALALIRTLDFLSETRPALPLGASGIGHVPLIRRRLIMIMNGTVPKRLTWIGGIAVCTLGGMLLPLLPTLGQDSSRPSDVDRARAEVKRLEAELEARRAQLREAEERLRKENPGEQERPEPKPTIRGDAGGKEINPTPRPAPNARPASTPRPAGGPPREDVEIEIERVGPGGFFWLRADDREMRDLLQQLERLATKKDFDENDRGELQALIRKLTERARPGEMKWPHAQGGPVPFKEGQSGIFLWRSDDKNQDFIIRRFHLDKGQPPGAVPPVPRVAPLPPVPQSPRAVQPPNVPQPPQIRKPATTPQPAPKESRGGELEKKIDQLQRELDELRRELRREK